MNNEAVDLASTEPSPARLAFEKLLRRMVDENASDMFLTVGAVPTLKVEGRMLNLGSARLEPGSVKRLAQAIMSRHDTRTFEKALEWDMALHLDQLGRFRVNVYVQRGEVSMVVRHVRDRIAPLAELRLPKVIEQIAMLRQGLVLVVGAAGAGKSTTIASLLDHRNHSAPGHILTIEDPIEFLHKHDKCIIDQREVGLDTHSFHEALRHALREAPDVIMIGEIRDVETMRHALHFAETGHLCVSTLHANSASQAFDRILNFFPEIAHRQVLMDLSMNLQAIVALRLLQDNHAKRRVPATEIMLASSYISQLIQRGEIDQIRTAISRSAPVGMHTFDQSLYDLYQEGAVTLEQALEHADSRTDLSLRIRLAGPAGPAGIEVESHLQPMGGAPA
ncbi:MAG TPA: PilT/PilU family type 4a pilus ATPase [Ramlibacter sp.]|nr:PilT/PilU family type 4a pilus ATPase [Ramlibacter sp.]